MTLRVIAYGGGVQSTALVILAAQGRLDDVMGGPPTHALFCNVGDDSEDPLTLSYVRDVMIPWVADKPIAIEVLDRIRRDKTVETLYKRLTRPGSRSLPIPVRMPDTGAPGTRSCTADFKIKVIGRWVKAHGATPDEPAQVAIGISTDEFHRANNRKQEPYEEMVYPLLELGLSRADCMQVARDAGLPVPPKSSCYFCPFHKPAFWSEMRRDRPELFEKAAALEDLLNERRDMLERDHVYFTRFGKPLREAIHTAQDTLFGDDTYGMENGGECDEGYCFV